MIKTVTREPEAVTLIHSAKQRRKYKRDQTVVTLQRLAVTLSSGRRIPLEPSYVASDYRAVRLAPESRQQQALHEIQAFLGNTSL